MSQKGGSERKFVKLTLIGFAGSFFQMKIAELGAFQATKWTVSGKIAATKSKFSNVVQNRVVPAIHFLHFFLILALFAQKLR